MSHEDNTLNESASLNEPPEACEGCSGLQARPSLLDVEDMGALALERLIRKANIAQHMLTDVMKQLTKLQASYMKSKLGQNKHKLQKGSRRKRSQRRSNSLSSTSSNAAS